MRQLTGRKSRILCLAFSPDGRNLAAATERCQTISLWDVADGTCRRWHPYADAPVRSLAYSADGKYLAVGDHIGLVLLYVRAKNKYDIELHAGDPFGTQWPVNALAFVPGQPFLMAASYELRLYNIEAKKGDVVFKSDGSDFTGLAVSPDGKTLAACSKSSDDSAEGVLETWDLNPVRKAPKWAGRLLGLLSLSFAPDGKTLATSQWSIVGLYDPDTGKRRTALTGHEGLVWQVAYHPAGHLLASGSSDGTVKFWDPIRGKCLRTFDWMIGKVRALVFSPDGMTCAAGGDTGRVVLWDVED